MIKVVYIKQLDKTKKVIRVWTTIKIIENDGTEYSSLVKMSCDVTKFPKQQQDEMFNIINKFLNKNHTLNKDSNIKKKKFWFW